MNVLSIDWDYFVDCTNTERADMFPDGGSEEIGISTSTFIWGMRYGVSRANKNRHPERREILDIGVKEKELQHVMATILMNVSSGCRFMFADSHADIYQFIKESKRTNNTKFDLFNIDHHSDCYNIGNDVNCGNWVNKLDAEGLLRRYTWIKGDNRDTIPEGTLTCQTKVTNKISAIDDRGWDLIFVCRSSIWSPPHLDKKFNEFYEYLDWWLGLELNPKFFVDRFSMIEDRLDGETEVAEQQLELMSEVAKYNKENCDCTEELKELQKIMSKII